MTPPVKTAQEARFLSLRTSRCRRRSLSLRGPLFSNGRVVDGTQGGAGGARDERMRPRRVLSRGVRRGADFRRNLPSVRIDPRALALSAHRAPCVRVYPITKMGRYGFQSGEAEVEARHPRRFGVLVFRVKTIRRRDGPRATTRRALRTRRASINTMAAMATCTRPSPACRLRLRPMRRPRLLGTVKAHRRQVRRRQGVPLPHPPRAAPRRPRRARLQPTMGLGQGLRRRSR